MKRRKRGLMKKFISLVLAVALVIASVSVAAPEAQAASKDDTLGTSEVLAAKHVKDTKVLQYYRILASMVQKNGASEAAAEVGEKDAETVIRTYAEDYDDANALASYLTEYPGKINFGTMSIQYVDGIGWARSASEIDLSNATFTTPLTKVPDSEFALCTKLKKILLPSTVTEIGNHAFESCQALETLGIGTPEEGVIDLAKVTTVGNSAFSVCTSISSVKFASYGTTDELKLGTSAFAGCTALDNVEVPIKTASNLGANVFENCESLSQVGLYDDLAYISNGAFKGTGKKAALQIQLIGKASSDNCQLPSKITYIGNNAFQDAILKTLDLSECSKLKTINQYAFAGATLPKLVLPDSLETIEAMAFNVTKMDEENSLILPESCDNICSKAFYESGIYAIHLPASLKKIEASTFEGCEYLDGARITIADGSQLEEIGENAFKDCERLETTEFLSECNKLTKIGARAFAHCYTVYLNPLNKNEVTNLYGDKSISDGLRTVILPDSVVTLEEEVFANNYALRTAKLGTGVTNIPDKAFYNETATSNRSGASLEKVIVSDQLDAIGVSAFENQSRLTTIGYTDGTKETVTDGTVQFAEGLLEIGKQAFAGCGIESTFSLAGVYAYVEQDNVYKTAGEGRTEFLVYDYLKYEQEENYCHSVYIDESDIVKKADISDEEIGQYTKLNILAKRVYVNPSEVFTTKSYASDPDNVQSFEAYEEYETDSKLYKNRFYLKDKSTLTTYYCDQKNAATAVATTNTDGWNPIWIKAVATNNVTNVSVKDSTSQSYPNAAYMFGIRNVIIPESVVGDKLGEKAFRGCVNLNEVKLSSKLTEIKDGTFEGAGSEIRNFFGSGDDDKLNDYCGLRTINIPDGIKRIGDNAFNDCSNLTLEKRGGSSFGRSVTYIGATAFSGCVSLSEIYFPDTLEEIGKEAFYGCALKYKDALEVTYSNSSTKKYKYYLNASEYGTKEKKNGLTVIDFTAAKKLEKVGEAAFAMTNVKDVSMVDSPLINIPNRLFEQCSYLRTISFQNKTESIGSKVLKDTVSLSGVSWPVKAVIQSDAICGAYGASVTTSDPTIKFLYDTNDTVVVPYGSSIRLPINAINDKTVNGDIKISVDTGNGVFQSILGEEVNGLLAEVGTEEDPYAFVLYGKSYIDEPVTVRVEVGTAFPYCEAANPNGYCTTPHTMEYQVKVSAVPTEQITVTAEEDTTVKANPSMYVQDSDKVLYLPATKTMVQKGIVLSAQVKPAQTTEDINWLCDNTDCFVISDTAYDESTGVATAVVKPMTDASGTPLVGTGKITVQSGTKSDEITVYTLIPVPSASNIVCTTDGENLSKDLKANTANNPFAMEIGAQDQITVSMDYGKTNYTDEELALYGEKYVFTSSDPSVIEVKSDGTIHALKAGTATVTVAGQASGSKLNFYFEVGEGLKPSPSSVEISGSNSVNIGETIELAANVLPAKADQRVTWKVTNGVENISVDENGVVTGLKKGNGTVVATSVEKNTVKSAAFQVKVLVPATQFKMLTSDFSIESGRTVRINKTTTDTATSGYYLYPSDTTDSVTWSSSAENIATVTGSSTGVSIKGEAPGTATITGVTDSGLEVRFQVNVIVKVTKITVDSTVKLNVGDTHQLNPAKEPANATEEVTYTYTSGNDKVATVSDTGFITAVGAGTANISVKTNTGKTATCRVTVTGTTGQTTTAQTSSAVPATKLTVLVNKPNAKKIYMAKGQSVVLKTKLDPVQTTDKVTYTSNKTKVAVVSASGMITAKKKGTAKITVTTTSGKKTTVTVVVSKKQVKAKKVKVKCAKSMKKGKTIRLKVTLKKKNSTDTLSFSSNKPTVATVDAYGYVTAKNVKGKVKITVTASSGKKATKTIKVK